MVRVIQYCLVDRTHFLIVVEGIDGVTGSVLCLSEGGGWNGSTCARTEQADDGRSQSGEDEARGFWNCCVFHFKFHMQVLICAVGNGWKMSATVKNGVFSIGAPLVPGASENRRCLL